MTDNKFRPDEHLIDMRGKKYLPVNWRVVWFREDHPKGSITTELIQDGLMKATVTNADGLILATGHGTPKQMGVAKSRPFEGAETAAIGRALALAGYGTQFTGEEEGEHLADAPIGEVSQSKGVWTVAQKQAVVKAGYAENDFEAKNMLEHSIIPRNSGDVVVTSWAKYYRAARDEGKEVVEAAQIANNKYSEAIKAGK